MVYGDVPVTTDTNIIDYSESVTYMGDGGPNIVPVASISGTVQAQQVHAYTPIYIVQSGFARGLSETPPAATPIFLTFNGVYYRPEKKSLSYLTPQRFGKNLNIGYGVRWSYTCWTSYAATPTQPQLPF